MAEGKTYWWAKDASWIDRDAIVELGEEFGPAGPLIIDVLSGMAKLENDAGRVFTGFRALARKCFTTPEDAEKVVAHAAKIGALDDLDVESDGRRFTARISGWQADQKKGRAADRDAQRRARTKAGDSRSLTSTHVPVGTGQDRTAQPQTPKPNVEFVGSVAELFEHWRTACGHPRAKLTDGRRRKIRARLKEGYTVEQLRQAIDGAAVGAFVNEQGVKFDDIELICRNGSKVEQFIARAGAKPPPPDGGYLDELRQMHAAATVVERQELAS